MSSCRVVQASSRVASDRAKPVTVARWMAARSVSSVLLPGSTGWRILLGDEGVDDAGLEAGGGEGALDEAVIAAGAFDGDEAVVELVLGEGVPDLGDGGVEVGAVVGDGGGRDEDVAVEVGEQELGAGLGAVDSRRCRSVRDRPAGRGGAARRAACRPRRAVGDRKTVCGYECGHETSLQEKG